jgi:hypothetical protein
MYITNIVISISQVKIIVTVVRLLDIEAFHVHIQCLFLPSLIFIYSTNIVISRSQVKIVVTVVHLLNIKAFHEHLECLL